MKNKQGKFFSLQSPNFGHLFYFYRGNGGWSCDNSQAKIGGFDSSSWTLRRFTPSKWRILRWGNLVNNLPESSRIFQIFGFWKKTNILSIDKKVLALELRFYPLKNKWNTVCTWLSTKQTLIQDEKMLNLHQCHNKIMHDKRIDVLFLYFLLLFWCFWFQTVGIALYPVSEQAT